jgi:hypothetical protein
VNRKVQEWVLAIAVMSVGLVGGGSVFGQVVTQIEDFEYAVNDVVATAGVTDLTDFENLPTYYFNGDGDGEFGASEGLFALGTDALFGGDLGILVPGSFIGCRRNISTDLFPSGIVELSHTYGDPNFPGAVSPDLPLSELTVLADMYGGEAFGEGLTGTNIWINLIDLEGERFNFVNFTEFALFLEDYTLDVVVGGGMIRIDPDSLIEVPGGDRLLTEIAAFEMLIQDDDDPPTGNGKWYIDNLRIVEPAVSALEGDFDGDGDVDLVDSVSFGECFTGANQTGLQPGCETFDFDVDDDVDFGDFSGFQRVFTGQF